MQILLILKRNESLDCLICNDAAPPLLVSPASISPTSSERIIWPALCINWRGRKKAVAIVRTRSLSKKCLLTYLSIGCVGGLLGEMIELKMIELKMIELKMIELKMIELWR